MVETKTLTGPSQRVTEKGFMTLVKITPDPTTQKRQTERGRVREK